MLDLFQTWLRSFHHTPEDDYDYVDLNLWRGITYAIVPAVLIWILIIWVTTKLIN